MAIATIDAMKAFKGSPGLPAEIAASDEMLPSASETRSEANAPIKPHAPAATVTSGDFSVTAMPCDHGALAPDALGLLITLDGKRIYITGDTAYREDYFANPALAGVDVLILPINGAFGNLNAEEGARVAGVIRAGLTIPCHYWNFAEHGGDPAAFATAMKEEHADLAYLLMRPGESISL